MVRVSGMACSSFIDEFVAKLYLELGRLEFNKRVVLVKMNDMISHLCERSVAMRVSEEWKNIVDVPADNE